MKKLLVAVAGLVAGFIAIVAVAVVDYQFTWPPTFPATPRPSLRASADPAVIARGEYLFHVAAHCTHCHSPMAEHWGKAVGLRVAPRDGTEIPLGPLVILHPPNITPDLETGIGAWSDADLVRVIVHGIRPDDTPALLMVAAGPMSDADLVALLSYMCAMPSQTTRAPSIDRRVGGRSKRVIPAVRCGSPKGVLHG